MKKVFIQLISAIFILMNANLASSESFDLPPQGIDLVGMIREVTVKPNEDLLEIGREYGIGVEAIENANPSIDIWSPAVGAKVLIPSRYILPKAARKGIVINLPEMRLYYFPKNENKVYVYAIGIGREDWSTPLGKQSIIQKRERPTWTPPVSIRREHAAKGDPLPAVVAGGEDNPLGLFAMRLSNPSYLIHGTNKPWGVGMRVSHGCIRLYPEGIEQLYGMVPKNTAVNIIKQEMKVGWYGDQLYLEYHPPIAEDNISKEQAKAQAMTWVHKEAAKYGLNVADDLIAAVIDEATGMPVAVATSRTH